MGSSTRPRRCSSSSSRSPATTQFRSWSRTCWSASAISTRQGGPRPLGYPNPSRPGQPGPVGVSPPFRSDQTRPAGPAPQGRPVQSPGGPLPQPWSPPKPAEKGEPGGASQGRDLANSPPPRPSQFGASESSRPTDEKTVEPSSPGGEMDWDTALDTILKTLKKDRGVGERT